MREDKLKKENDSLSDQELEQVTGGTGIQRPVPPPAPGSGSGM